MGPDGEALDEARIEPPVIGFLADDLAQDRIPVALGDLPDHVVEAFLAIEDHRFHEHSGIDVRRIAGALVANLRAGRIVQGGSTITQQLARSLFLNRQQVLSRKLQEAVLALALERRFAKDEILELYLNEIYLGQRGGLAVHGVGAASRLYFGDRRRRRERAPGCAAGRHGTRPEPLLADEERRALPRAPRRRARPHGRTRLPRRRERRARAIGSRSTSGPAPKQLRSARYFVDYVHNDLAERHEASMLGATGARIFTTLDWRLQENAERAMREGLEDLEERAPKLMKREEPVQAALLALDPHTGDVLAMVGGRDYAQTQFNRATDAKRQPGSVFKTIVALAAVAPPDPAFTLASVLIDEPIVFDPPEPLPGEEPEEPWGPQNHDEEYRGEVTLRQAIEQSLNIPDGPARTRRGPAGARSRPRASSASAAVCVPCRASRWARSGSRCWR